MLSWCSDIFSTVFNFLWWFVSLPVLGDITILDVGTYGLVTGACMRFLILPLFDKGAMFTSSSIEKRKSDKSYRSDQKLLHAERMKQYHERQKKNKK